MVEHCKQQALGLVRTVDISVIYDLAVGHSDIAFDENAYAFVVVPAFSNTERLLWGDGPLWLEQLPEFYTRKGEQLRIQMIETIDDFYDYWVDMWKC